MLLQLDTGKYANVVPKILSKPPNLSVMGGNVKICFDTKYNQPLNNVGVRDTDPLCSRKSVYTIWLPQNLTPNTYCWLEAFLRA